MVCLWDDKIPTMFLEFMNLLTFCQSEEQLRASVKDFAEKHPEFLTQFVKVTGAAYAKYNADPKGYAANNANVDKIARLTGAKQFVAAEGHQIEACGYAVLHRRFTMSCKRNRQQRPAADIID